MLSNGESDGGWFERNSSFEVKFVVNFSLQTKRRAKKMLGGMLMYRSALMMWMKVLKAFGVVRSQHGQRALFSL
jgi:hypothetical protein